MPIISVPEASQRQDIDVIVVGGGTAGLVVAVRIAQSTPLNVLVLEAGVSHEDDPLVDVPGLISRTLGNPHYDWNYVSAPQTRLGNRVIPLDHGKGLGGSSAINFNGFFHPTAEEFDAFERLGNPGWGEHELRRCLQRVERSKIPTEDCDLGFIATSQPPFVPHIHDFVVEGFESLGVPRINRCGLGVSTTTLTVDVGSSSTVKRSYSANGYYHPNRDLKNLFVALEATVTKVNLTPIENGLLRAVSVRVESLDQVLYPVKARKEIILSAGALHTPHILELSGIGDKNILSNVGIECLVDLPGVGENLQDHGLVPTVAEVGKENETAEMLAESDILEAHQELYKQKKGFLSSGVTTLVAFLPANRVGIDSNCSKGVVVDEVDADIRINPDVRRGILKQYDILTRWLQEHDQTERFAQVLHLNAHFPTPGISTPQPGKRYITLSPVYSHPFSRGYVHLASKDPKIPPVVNPRYFSHPLDKQILEAGLNLTLQLYETPSLKPFIINIVAGSVQDSERSEYVKGQFNTVWHQSGTASMLPREDGGVVDHLLRVYGTVGLRVADASIIPLLPSVNTQSVVYTMAERAAEIILSEI